MSDRDFLKLQFDGPRFEDDSVPVDVLRDLATLQKLIERVARWNYLVHHGDRSRVPKGFSEAAKLKLTRIEHKCWRGNLARNSTDSWGNGTIDDQELFERSREQSLALLANDNALEIAKVPPDIRRLVVLLGEKLKKGEQLQIHGSKASAVVTVDSRRKLAQLARVPIVAEDYPIEGEVETFNVRTERVVVRDDETGGSYEIAFDADQKDSLIEAARKAPALRVALTGTVEWTRGNAKVRHIESLQLVEHDRAADIYKMWERIDSFDAIKDGWDDEESLAPTSLARATARKTLARAMAESDAIERPRVFPSHNGGVQAEWTRGSVAVDVEFDPDGMRLVGAATNTATGETVEEEFLAEELQRTSAGALVVWLAQVTAGG